MDKIEGKERWSLVRYTAEMASQWDHFVDQSRNATFLFKRGYMDYHADRFNDCSWMAYKSGKLMALLPANLDSEGTLHSHQGLTYGGWILPKQHFDGSDMLTLFTIACSVWKDMGIKQLIYAPLPSIYALYPSQEDLYALFRLGGQICECMLSEAIDLRNPLPYNTMQKRHLAKTEKMIGMVREYDDIERFMMLLKECLSERHNAQPVHTVEELRLLKSRFPNEIRIFGIEGEDGLAAGVCIYDTGLVAHTQYIATLEEGRMKNMLTPLFTRLLRDEFKDRHYFDFGTSCRDHGRILNTGLLRQKASYGATGTAYQRYQLNL